MAYRTPTVVLNEYDANLPVAVDSICSAKSPSAGLAATEVKVTSPDQPTVPLASLSTDVALPVSLRSLKVVTSAMLLSVDIFPAASSALTVKL